MGLFDTFKRAAADALGNAASGAVKKAVSGAPVEANKTAAASVPRESQTFTFASLPKTVEDLQSLPEAALDTPFKTAALTVCALCAYPENKEASKAMQNFLKGPQPLTPREEQFLADRFMDGKQYIPFSYFAGATPENNYTPSVPYTVTVFSNPYSYQEENYAVLFVRSGGADSERQIKLRRKGDQWFLWEQFLLAGIREPKANDPWA